MSGALVAHAHNLGWLAAFTSAENLRPWWALEWATLGLVANYVYDRFFADPGELIEAIATARLTSGRRTLPYHGKIGYPGLGLSLKPRATASCNG